MKKLIGIVGYRKVGKSTARDYLVRVHGCVHRPFAGPLKNMLRVLGLAEAHLDGGLKEEPCELLMGRTPRYAMQRLGTEWGRDMIHSDLWVETWKREVAKVGAPVVADDLRFPNEAVALRALGGFVLRLRRQGRNASDHPSETELDGIQPDFTINNNGTPEELYGALREVWR